MTAPRRKIFTPYSLVGATCHALYTLIFEVMLNTISPIISTYMYYVLRVSFAERPANYLYIIKWARPSVSSEPLPVSLRLNKRLQLFNGVGSPSRAHLGGMTSLRAVVRSNKLKALIGANPCMMLSIAACYRLYCEERVMFTYTNWRPISSRPTTSNRFKDIWCPCWHKPVSRWFFSDPATDIASSGVSSSRRSKCVMTGPSAIPCLASSNLDA